VQQSASQRERGGTLTDSAGQVGVALVDVRGDAQQQVCTNDCEEPLGTLEHCSCLLIACIQDVFATCTETEPSFSCISCWLTILVHISFASQSPAITMTTDGQFKNNSRWAQRHTLSHGVVLHCLLTLTLPTLRSFAASPACSA
jgi:hypothetical protein